MTKAATSPEGKTKSCLETGAVLSGLGRLRPGRSGRRTNASGVNTTEIREWAKSQGIEVKDHGRTLAELVVKFKAATASRNDATSRQS